MAITMEESENKNISDPIDSRNNAALFPIENLIHVIRGQQVMIDSDLARLYGVETKMAQAENTVHGFMEKC